MRLFLILWLCLQPSGLSAQVPFGDNPEAIARGRRATRERAVAHAGSIARTFVESDVGDEAAKALLVCTKDTAARLAEFYTSGGFSRLRAKELLGVISAQRQADEIANWIVEHANELIDRDAHEMFCLEPYSYALSLKSLSNSAADRKANRLDTEKNTKPLEKKQDPPETQWSLPYVKDSDRRCIIGITAALGVVGIAVRLRRKQLERDFPA